jgi:hypothetical protein
VATGWSLQVVLFRRRADKAAVDAVIGNALQLSKAVDPTTFPPHGCFTRAGVFRPAMRCVAQSTGLWPTRTTAVSLKT